MKKMMKMMKCVLGFLLLMVSFLLQAQVTFNEEDLKTIAGAEERAHEGKLSPCFLGNTNNYDVKWYRCRWNIDPAIHAISGNVTTLFSPVRQDFDTLIFDLNQALTVDSVIYHNHQLIWSHTSDLLTIRFSNVLTQNVADSVSVYYHGVPADNGFGSFVKETQHGLPDGTPIIWTLSEPYGSSDWWPCKNGLTDKADSMDIYISTPAIYQTASNGLLVSVSPEGANSTYHWKHRYPIATYLVCLSVTKYARYTELVPYAGDTLEVINYVYPGDSAAAVAQTANIVPMIQLFDTLFGLYPFQQEKYGHAQFGWGGGMEHQTMTFVSSFGFELLAHELAHQWFGDKITCGSWTDIWLNEGFGTYLSGLCYEHLAPAWWKRIGILQRYYKRQPDFFEQAFICQRSHDSPSAQMDHG
jgi:aminopeptidase N